jgi:DNA-binding IclR family transcriptional regulator
LPPGQQRVKIGQKEGTTARTGQPAVRHVAAVERAFRVLDTLADREELGTNEIARRTGINASTVSRLLATLAAARYVEHVPESGRYRLSLRLLELGNAVLGRLDLRGLARPHLQELVRLTGETATLSVPGEHDAVTVDFAHSSSSVQSVAQIGRPSVGHATAVGKVMLAYGEVGPPAPPLVAFTPRTITSVERLAEELERVRRRGFAEAREERDVGLAAVAAPVFDSRGDLAGILGVQGPSSRFDVPAMRAAVTLLGEHADALAGTLGWPGRRPSAG